MCLTPLLGTDLGAKVANFITASDASMRGGAISISRTLASSGSDFVHSAKLAVDQCKKIPVLLISLFNGIGGAARCYDVLGVQVEGMIFCDLCSEANRISLRRWPIAELVEDVRDIDEALVRSWLLKYTKIKEVHLWAGFPCNDLSSAKKGRRNLQGDKSRLFFEIPRVRDLIKKVFGEAIILKEAYENVASMDQSAEREISSHLGLSPYFLDPVEAVPIHRPRLCWTTEPIEDLIAGVEVVVELRWRRVVAPSPWPAEEAWVSPGWRWQGADEQIPLPTAMRVVPKECAPPHPAGIERCDHDTLSSMRQINFEYLLISISGPF